MGEQEVSLTRKRFFKCLFNFGVLFKTLGELREDLLNKRKESSEYDINIALATANRVADYCAIPMNEIIRHLKDALKEVSEEDFYDAFDHARRASFILYDIFSKEGVKGILE